MLFSQEFGTHLNYWREILQHFPDVLDITRGEDLPRMVVLHTQVVTMRLSSRSCLVLGRVSRQIECTSFMLFLLAFEMLLHFETGAASFAIGSNVSNRTLPEFDGTVGLFLNTTILVADLGGDPILMELARRVRTSVVGTLEQQDLPFEIVVQAAQQEFGKSRNTLFNVMLIYQRPVDSVGWEMEAEPSGRFRRTIEFTPTNCDLIMKVAQRRSTTIDVSLHYKSGTFDFTRVCRLLECFEQLIELLDSSLDVHLSEVGSRLRS
jgi:non-ribosomal peptide synthetase component F